jgi:two-component system sensor histidine kinase VicK
VGYLLVIILALAAVAGVTFFFKRREKAADQLKQEFITVVTHKFRTPLTGIKWAVGSLHDNVSFQNKEDLLKEIERATQRIVEIIDLLTEFATYDAKGQNAYEFVPARQLVEAALDKQAEAIRTKQITFNIQVSDDVPALFVDKSRIQFALDVLVENAVKYTPAGGIISISAVRDKQFVVLSLTDTGIGLTKEELSYVGESFWRGAEAKTADPNGMGLGVSTARSIVRRHGGELWAESPGRGQGATFHLRLKIEGYNFKFK